MALKSALAQPGLLAAQPPVARSVRLIRFVDASASTTTRPTKPETDRISRFAAASSRALIACGIVSSTEKGVDACRVAAYRRRRKKKRNA